MMVTVLLFAGLRDSVGSDRLELELADDLLVNDLWSEIENLHPATSGYRGRVAFAIGDRIVSAESPLGSAGEVAVLPPISGG